MKQFDVVTIGGAVKDIIFFSDQVFAVEDKKDSRNPKLLAEKYKAWWLVPRLRAIKNYLEKDEDVKEFRYLL